jgi:hypothetical protein
MGSLNIMDTVLTEALYKTVKAAFCHSYIVGFIPQICFCNDQWLSVGMRCVTLRYLANEELGSCSSIIKGHYVKSNKVRLTFQLFAGLKPYTTSATIKKS